MADILGTFKNLKFLLKFINLILVLICLIVWVIEDDDHRKMENGMMKAGQHVLYAHTVPAYVVILFVLVIAFFLDEEPGKWTSRLVLIPGAILFLVTGIIAFVNKSENGQLLSTRTIITGILCVVVGVIMIVDLLKTENVF